MKAIEVLDKEVIGAQGWKIGQIKDIIFDETEWRVSAIEVELEGSVADEFNMKQHFRKTRFPIDIHHVQAISGDRAILRSSKDELFNQLAQQEQKQKIPT